MARRWIHWTSRLALWAAGSGLALGAALPAGAQPPIAAGAQFQVNTYTPDNQVGPSVAVEANGDFVVVWRGSASPGTDSSLESVHGQRYASNGSPLGAEFQINTFTTSVQDDPSMAADSDGDFVVVWRSYGSSGTDSSSSSIQGQRYASSGSAVGGEFQVNSYTTSNQSEPSVAADSDGDFVVVWRSTGSPGTDASGYSIQGQRYASSGSAVGAQFQINAYTTDSQSAPSVAADTDGDFLVAWHSNGSLGTDTSASSVQGQRYTSSGSALGTQFQVNAYTTSYQARPAVGRDAEGDFVVAWTSNGSSGTDTSYSSVQGQRYTSSGSAVGAEFQVNSYTTSGQNNASVGVDEDGDFVVTWGSDGSPGTDTEILSVQGQRYASNGSAQGAQFQVNTYTTSSQYTTSVAAAPDGNFVVAWDSLGSGETDTSALSIQAQRYRAPIVAPALSSATRIALGAALLLLGAAVARAYGSVSRRSRFSR